MSGTTPNGRSVLEHTFGNQTGTTIGVINANGSTTFTGAPQVPAFNQRAGIYALLVTVSAATMLTVQDTAGHALSQAFQLPANGSIALDLMSGGDPWWQAQPGLGLQFSLSASATVGYDVYWLPSV